MLQNVFNQPDQLPIDDISSPLGAQIFELCDPDLFQEPLQNSEATSSPNCCYEDNSSYTTNLSFPQQVNNNDNNNNNYPNNPLDKTTTAATSTTTTAATTTNHNTSNLSVIFDSPEEIQNDITAAIDFTQTNPFPLPTFYSNHQDQFDLSSLQSQGPLTDSLVNGIQDYASDPVVPLMGLPLPSVFEEECLSLVPSYMRLNSSAAPSSCSFLEPTNSMGQYLPSNLSNTIVGDNSGIFPGNLFLGNEIQSQELDFQGENGGIFCPEPLPRIYNSTELQPISTESQHVVNGGGSSTTLASDISSLEDSTFKVGKLSVEQRKEKIHRYMKKRKERNFSKKIKYACRKTLADSRPRVRGRFAKNDEFNEIPRTACNNHEEDTDEDSLQVVVKEEEDMMDSSDIFAHISGVNSFKCNYTIQSWI